MADPFTHFYQLKSAIAAAGLYDDALAMDGVLAGSSFEEAWGFVGRFREHIRQREYRDALASMKCSDNDSACAAALLKALNLYSQRQYEIDRKSGIAPVGKTAVLFVILNGDGGKILSRDTYRKKFANLQVGMSAPKRMPTHGHIIGE